LNSDAGQQHFLKSSFGLANPRQQQLQQHQQQLVQRGSTRGAGASGSSTPNSLYGVSASCLHSISLHCVKTTFGMPFSETATKQQGVSRL
jgi:hypothetical protein